MAYPRHITVPPDTPGVYHCTSRCVRRAYLCGEDTATGRNFDHRKPWMENRILQLAKIFAVAVHGYAVMSNHFHLVIETNPDAVSDWSDEEIATRWLSLTNNAKAIDLSYQSRIDRLISQPEFLMSLRQRLGSLSWYMRYLKEPIARRANKEDDCTGHFWEGRFNVQSLLDDAAVLSAMVYVDLNPVRAGISQTPEESVHTSIKRRIEHIGKHHHDSLRPLASSFESQRIPGTLDEYLNLVDWSARLLHSGKKSFIANDTPEILTRLKLRKCQWLIQVPATESHYWRAIGRVESLLALAQSSGARWIRGIGLARRLEHLPDTA